MSLERLKKSQTIPFIDTSSTSTASWKRIGKSTIFDLTLNAVTEENDFIEDDTATTDVVRYAPSLAQELQCNKGDDAFDFLYDLFFNLPTGEKAKKSLMIVFAGDISTGEANDTTPKFKAWSTQATLVLDHFDSVAEKIYFNFTINTITRGTATIASGVPSFTAAS